MGKVSKTCCIKSCENKSGKAENDHSFHIFPSEDAEIYEAWVAAVRPHQKTPKPSQKHFYVCDEHFDQNCFVEEGCKILVNGVEKTIPRKMKRLKRNSVPSISYELKENKADCEILVTEPKVSLADHAVNIDEQYTMVKQERTESPLTVPCMENVKSEYYSREELIKDWNHHHFDILLKNWGITETPENLLFVYYGGNVCFSLIQKVLIVKGDMSTELQFCGRISSYPIVKRIECFNDLRTTLTTINCLQKCMGFNCRDGLFLPETSSKGVRCIPCQKILRLERDRERKCTKSLKKVRIIKFIK